MTPVTGVTGETGRRPDPRHDAPRPATPREETSC